MIVFPDLDAAVQAIADVFPLRTRVQVRDTGAYGTVALWSFAGGGALYLVDLDDGGRVVVDPWAIERAAPRPGWQADAVVLSGRRP